MVATAPASSQSGARPSQCVGWRKNISAAHPRRQRGSYLPDELSRICETNVAPNKWTSADQQRTDDSAYSKWFDPWQSRRQSYRSARHRSPDSGERRHQRTGQSRRESHTDRDWTRPHLNRRDELRVTDQPRLKAPSSPGADAPAQPRDEDVAAEVTRSGSVVADLRLKEVKKVYIEMRGDAAFNQLRSNLVESLGSSGVVAVATDADEADASLKIVFSQTSAGGPQIESALLVNARGTVLWPKAGQSARRYSGETTKVLSEIVKDLLSEIRLARAGH